ncbi:MAG TPA: hypothetical protein VHM30_01315 [Gemmatimonadaceae bacterium]|nr:hypothetical protein [Gemmatimonadaceae bacterium]
MYVCIAWHVRDAASTGPVRQHILDELRHRPFDNVFEPFEGAVFASIRTGYTRDEVTDLQNALRQGADGIWSFTISSSERGYSINRSLDIGKDACDRVANA